MARSAKKQAAVADADGMSSASSAGGRPGNAGETIYRMSKKIAQLTKVVYYLNTRQEDHAVETSDLARVYEEEICDIVTDAQLQIGDLKQRLDEAEELSAKYCGAAEEYAEYKAAAEGRQTDLEEELKISNETRENLQRQVESLAEAAENAAREYAGELRRLGDEHEQNINQMKHEREAQKMAYESEIETLKEEQAKAIASMINDQQTADEAFELEREGFRRQLEGVKLDHEIEIGQICHLNEKKMAELEDELERKAAQAMDLLEEERENVKAANGTIARLQQEIEMNAKEISKLRGGLADTQQAMAGKINQIKNFATQQEKLMGDLVMARELNTRNESEIADLQKKLVNEKDHVSELVEAAKTQAAENEALGLKSKELAISLAATTKERDNFELQLKELETFQQRLDALRAEKEMVRASLTAELNHQKYAAAEELEDKLAKQKESLTAEFTEARLQSEKQIRKDFGERLDEKRKHIETLKQEMARNTIVAARELSEVKENHLVEMTNLGTRKSELERHRDGLLEQIAVLDEEVENQGKEIDRLNRAMKVADAQISSLELDKADLIQRMIQHDRSVRMELEAEYSKKAEEFQKQLQNEKQQELQKTILDLESRLVRELEEQQLQTSAKYVLEIRKIESSFAAERENFQFALQDLREIITSKDDNIIEDARALEETKKAHAKELAAERAKHEADLQRLRQEADAELSAKETQLRVETSIAVSKLEKKHQQLTADAAAAAKKELEDLRAFNRVASVTMKKELEFQKAAEITAVVSEHEAAVRKLSVERAKAIELVTEEMDRRRERELAALEETHRADLGQKTQEIERLQRAIVILQEEKAALQDVIDKHKTEIVSLQLNVRRREEDFEAAKAEAKETLLQMQERLEQRRQADIRKLQEDHLTESKSMLRDFEQAQIFFKKQTAADAKKLEEADIKYKNREPREVDLKRIAELEEELKRKKRKISMMSDELERYKLELNNREDNLNRMFNTKPNVGVIRPLDVLRRKVDGRSDPTPLSRLPPLYMSQYNANMAPQSVHSSTSTLAAAKPMAGVPPAVPANIPTSVLQQ